ncbi:hypothetical protein M378DRAFT_156650 [Amanita muscaria Koide BX008]|uniref:NACHT domain-containing protein n=1 Tax=Amanita muscaria (strain Koide BX008) TaxID=946122 RepID=A0A0C2T3R8_AMAMK|nr:hypothetical protein M378DRAFT_156650 [Amanita muscaria Koide BX008]
MENLESNNESQPLLQPRNTYRKFLASVGCQLYHHLITIPLQIPNDGIVLPSTDEHSPSTPILPGSYPAERCRPVSEEVTASASQAREELGQHDAVCNLSAFDIPVLPAASHNLSHNERSHTPVPSESMTTAQFQGAYGFSISGNPNFTNIGSQTHVNNYRGSHGLEHMEKFVSFNAFHNSSAQDPDRKCHPGTRVVVLNRIQNWFDNTTSAERACWLHGPAGAGKSAIAQTIAQSYSQEQVVATFFFYRSDTSRNDGNCLFPTIAWQLAFSIPGIKDHIARALDRRPDLPRMGIETQFEEFIVRPFQALKDASTHLRSLVIIIDGVDECIDEKLQRRFLKLIGNAIKDNHFPLRFLICSRPEAHIQETINRFPKPNLQIDLASLDDANHDIEKYLKDEFSRIASEQDLDSTTWPGHAKIQQVIYKSSGQFIYASTVIRYVSDEYNSAVAQLDIILGLKPPSSKSPFAELDALFMEILERQPDQAFLMTFLGLLVARLSIPPLLYQFGGLKDDFHLDDAMLMNVSEFELHRKLRGMRSLFKFEPHIDLHHRTFLDFLQDSSRSGQFYMSLENAQRRYLDLITDSVVRFAERTIDQPNYHETGHFCPRFHRIAHVHPRRLVLPVTEWQQGLKPLFYLQDKLLKLPNFTSTWNLLPCGTCTVFPIMRDLLSHFIVMQGTSHPVTSFDQTMELCLNQSDVNKSSDIGAEQNVCEDDLVGSVYSLLSQLRKAKLEPLANATTINLVCSLLCFDYAEIAKRVNSIADAQVLMDFIDSLTNDDYFLCQYGPDTACELVRLTLELYARVPVLPRSVFPDSDICAGHDDWRCPPNRNFEIRCQAALLRRISDHNYVVPLLRIYERNDDLWFVDSIANESKSLKTWRDASKPSSVERIRAMLEVAKAIRYLHSIGTVFDSDMDLVCKQAHFGKIYQGHMLSG